MPFVQPIAPKILPPSDGIIRDGLISRWLFDDGTGSTTARDDQSTNTAVLDPLMDPQTVWVEGRLGGDTALEFSDRPHKADVAHAAELNPANISIAGWFKYIFDAGTWGGMIGKTNTSWNRGYGIYQGTDLRFFYGNYTRAATFVLSRADRAWHLVIGTWDGTTKRIYLDDVEGTPDVEAESAQTGTDDIMIAQLPAGDNVYAIMQDFRIYNRALNASERTAIFNGTG